MMPQTGQLGSVSIILYYTARVYALIHPRVYQRLLEYMGFVLVVFPLKCGFIIVQVFVCACLLLPVGCV
jgi:hypothetical protein